MPHLAAAVGERTLDRDQNLQTAAESIEDSFKSLPYIAKEQDCVAEGLKVKNIFIEIAGRQLANEIVAVGARYSQHDPAGFSFFLLSKGNFVGFVGNLSSRSLVHDSIGHFPKTTQSPSDGIAAPGGMTGIGWSDHWSFWREGYRS